MCSDKAYNELCLCSEMRHTTEKQQQQLHGYIKVKYKSLKSNISKIKISVLELLCMKVFGGIA